ncbi:MAG: CNP1-like family protein [Pseudomonadota bacterium]
MKRLEWAVVACLAAWPMLAAAAGEDFDEAEPIWTEAATALPALPKPSDLVEFTVGGGRSHRYYLDPAAISVGADGVVRYTLVMRTAGGAENTHYEGLRCATGERKIYAFAGRDGIWSPNRAAAWARIDARGDHSYHKELFFHYLCTVDGAGNELATIRRALARGGLRRGGD